MKFTASKDITEEEKQVCVKQIKKGAEHCSECTSTEIEYMCLKHKKMYGTIYP